MVEKAYGLADELGRKKAVRSYQYDRATAKAVETCKQAGIAYGEYLLAKQAADQNGNGSVTKDEAKPTWTPEATCENPRKRACSAPFPPPSKTPINNKKAPPLHNRKGGVLFIRFQYRKGRGTGQAFLASSSEHVLTVRNPSSRSQIGA